MHFNGKSNLQGYELENIWLFIVYSSLYPMQQLATFRVGILHIHVLISVDMTWIVRSWHLSESGGSLQMGGKNLRDYWLTLVETISCHLKGSLGACELA